MMRPFGGPVLDGARELFARHGLRCTRQRELLYEALCACTSHPTAEELFRMTHRSEGAADPDPLSLATVYNTLDALIACGLARRLASPGGPTRYDADVTDHVHVSTGDGRILDLPPDLSERVLSRVPESLLDEIGRRMGVRVAGLTVQVHADPRRA